MRPVTDLKRRVAPIQVVTDMVPAGDQPQAIAEITRRLGDPKITGPGALQEVLAVLAELLLPGG